MSSLNKEDNLPFWDKIITDLTTSEIRNNLIINEIKTFNK